MKLEEKGAKGSGTKAEIMKYKIMAELRKYRNQKVADSIDSWDIVNDEGEKEKMIFDSSHVVGGTVIKKFIRRRRLR